MFSKACENGIRAVLLIASRSLNHERIGFKEIAKEIGAPEAYTAKIVQNLARQNIIRSAKGPKGGFYMEQKEIESVKLGQIIRGTDGTKLLDGCALGLKECDAKHPCPLHNETTEIKKNMRAMLDNTSVYQLAMGLDQGLAYLKR